MKGTVFCKRLQRRTWRCEQPAIACSAHRMRRRRYWLGRRRRRKGDCSRRSKNHGKHLDFVFIINPPPQSSLRCSLSITRGAIGRQPRLYRFKRFPFRRLPSSGMDLREHTALNAQIQASRQVNTVIYWQNFAFQSGLKEKLSFTLLTAGTGITKPQIADADRAVSSNVQNYATPIGSALR